MRQSLDREVNDDEHYLLLEDRDGEYTTGAAIDVLEGINQIVGIGVQ